MKPLPPVISTCMEFPFDTAWPKPNCEPGHKYARLMPSESPHGDSLGSHTGRRREPIRLPQARGSNSDGMTRDDTARTCDSAMPKIHRSQVQETSARQWRGWRPKIEKPRRSGAFCLHDCQKARGSKIHAAHAAHSAHAAATAEIGRAHV